MDLKIAKGINIQEGLPPDRKWLVTEKVDGVRRYFYKDRQGRVKAYSSSNKEDPYLSHICKYLENPIFPKDMVYDTELVDRKAYLNNVESFKLRTITIGKANKKGVKNKKDLMALVFDVYKPGSTLPGFIRYEFLKELFGHLPSKGPISMIPFLGIVESDDIDLINELADEVISNNGEGVMLMDLDSMHIPGRSKMFIKVKRKKDYVGKIVDYEIGRKGTKIANGVSVLICQVDECTTPVRVGSGLTNEQRKRLAKLGNDILGRKVEIEAFGKTSSYNGTKISLSMPIFKRFINF